MGRVAEIHAELTRARNMGFDLDNDDQAAFAQLQQERQQRAVEAARRILKDAPMDDVRVLTDEIGITELVFVTKGK